MFFGLADVSFGKIYGILFAVMIVADKMRIGLAVLFAQVLRTI